MNSLFPTSTVIYSRGRLLDFSKPLVMGVLNATPNSFYNRGRGSDLDSLLRTAEKMLAEGAAILDLGGASSKPGEPLIAASDELARVMPVVLAIAKHFPEAWLSIDTYNAQVAKETVHAGVSIVNDISAGEIDPQMHATVAQLQVPYLLMHMQGKPMTMQQAPTYTNVVAEVRNYLVTRTEMCVAAGIRDVIIDPGFGFGKTIAHNFELLAHLSEFRIMGRPILAGMSRKSMVCRPLNISPENALNGTTALNMAALLQGAHLLRVHDVREACETVKLYNCMRGAD